MSHYGMVKWIKIHVCNAVNQELKLAVLRFYFNACKTFFRQIQTMKYCFSSSNETYNLHFVSSIQDVLIFDKTFEDIFLIYY